MEKVLYIATEECRMQVRGLAVFVGAHTHTCCVRPGINTAVRVARMARQVPSSARNEQVKLLTPFFFVGASPTRRREQHGASLLVHYSLCAWFWFWILRFWFWISLYRATFSVFIFRCMPPAASCSSSLLSTTSASPSLPRRLQRQPYVQPVAAT